jgi:tRNA(Ile)-lysidine synthase
MKLEDIRQTIEKHRLFTDERPVVVGVSGGADSLCLLECLSKLGYSLIVAHFNHGLRPESDAEALFVRHEAEKRGITFVQGKKDVALLASENNWSIEEAARKVRYPFLYKVAVDYEAQAVAVAHNADDQVETILLNLIRGAGLDGLSGMRMRSINPEWHSEIPLVRPLLATWRAEIEEFCREQSLRPVLDASNLDTVYTRNRLRLELLPQLEKYNVQIKQRIFQMGQTLNTDLELITGLADQAWAECLKEESESWIQFSLDSFLCHPPAIQARIIRRCIESLRPNFRDLDFNTIQRALAFLVEPSASKRMDMIANLDIYIRGENFYLLDSGMEIILETWPQMEPEKVFHLEIPGRIDLGDGWQFIIQVVPPIDDPKLLDNRNDPFEVMLDADHFAGYLILRSRRPGDRFQPLGMMGRSMKLSDFMVNEKMPREARQKWPLLFDDDELIWVPGYRPADKYRVSAETRKLIKCRLISVI